MKKNQGTELYRFIMTMVICLHHFRLYSDSLPYGGGYMAVEFFFILSGCFLYRHGNKYMENNMSDCISQTWKYISGRYIRLLPEYLLVLTISEIIYIVVLKIHVNIVDIILKLFMLEWIFTGKIQDVMPQGWYCSSLIFASAVVYFLYIRFKDCFVLKIALPMAIVIYMVLLFKYGYLNLYTQVGFGVTVGTFRGIAGLCLGCVLGKLTDIRPVKIFKNKYLVGIMYLAFTCVVLYGLLWNIGYNKSDFLMPIAFMVILYFLLSENCISLFLDRFKFGFCGKISYMMFLVHHLIATIFDRYDLLRSLDWKISSIAYILVVIVVSIVMKKLIEIATYFTKINKFKENRV